MKWGGIDKTKQKTINKLENGEKFDLFGVSLKPAETKGQQLMRVR